MEQIKIMINSPIKILDIKSLNRKILNNDIKEYIPTRTILATFEGSISQDIFHCICWHFQYPSIYLL